MKSYINYYLGSKIKFVCGLFFTSTFFYGFRLNFAISSVFIKNVVETQTFTYVTSVTPFHLRYFRYTAPRSCSNLPQTSRSLYGGLRLLLQMKNMVIFNHKPTQKHQNYPPLQCCCCRPRPPPQPSPPRGDRIVSLSSLRSANKTLQLGGNEMNYSSKCRLYFKYFMPSTTVTTTTTADGAVFST